MISASQAIPLYLDSIRIAKNKSDNTRRTYRHALRKFSRIIGKKDELSEENFKKFLRETANLSSASQHTYMAAVCKLYSYYAPDVPIDLLKERHSQKIRKSFIQYNESGVEKLLDYAETGLIQKPAEDERERLSILRDRAFILTLADTGLRISEACSLTRGDIDFDRARALIIGKGDKPGIIRFSKRSLEAIRLYLSARAEIDGKSGRPISSLPVFARHDPGAGKKIKRISYKSMGESFRARAKEAGISEEEIAESGPVTAHKLRHNYVTKIIRETRDVSIAKLLARHEDVNTTLRYGHLAEGEIDSAYREIFDK